MNNKIGPSFSIIIPTLNEEKYLQRTLDSVESQHQVIVVDGGSTDKTVQIARKNRAMVLQSVKGRAAQQNMGAGKASGEILIFLHADTVLPEVYPELVTEKIMQEKCIAGAFKLSIDSHRKNVHLVSWMANARAYFLQLPYGDQALFMKAVSFHDAGGFPDMPIMEDFALIQQLKKKGRICLVGAKVICSARRWENLGVIRTTVINQIIVAGYLLGLSPKFLAKFYRVGKKF